MSGGRWRETENKGIYQIFGLKSGRGRLRYSSSGRLLIWLHEKQNEYFQSHRYKSVDCIPTNEQK